MAKQQLEIKVGTVLVNPYNNLQNWTVVEIHEDWATIRWDDGHETAGSMPTPDRHTALEAAIIRSTELVAGVNLQRREAGVPEYEETR